MPPVTRLAKRPLYSDSLEFPFGSHRGALYFVNLFDLIPDFIPLIGFVDDAAVLGLVLRAIQKDVQKYQGWTEQQRGGEKNNQD